MPHTKKQTTAFSQWSELQKKRRVAFQSINDGTYAFVLAMFHFDQQQLEVPVKMESTVQNRAIIDINATVEANQNIVSDLPAIHALLGCDTVSVYKSYSY